MDQLISGLARVIIGHNKSGFLFPLQSFAEENFEQVCTGHFTKTHCRKFNEQHSHFTGSRTQPRSMGMRRNVLRLNFLPKRVSHEFAIRSSPAQAGHHLRESIMTRSVSAETMQDSLFLKWSGSAFQKLKRLERLFVVV